MVDDKILERKCNVYRKCRARQQKLNFSHHCQLRVCDLRFGKTAHCACWRRPTRTLQHPHLVLWLQSCSHFPNATRMQQKSCMRPARLHKSKNRNRAGTTAHIAQSNVSAQSRLHSVSQRFTRAMLHRNCWNECIPSFCVRLSKRQCPFKQIRVHEV